MTTPFVRQIGFILTDGFSMIAFSNAIEVFRMANYASGSTLYQLAVSGSGEGQTVASNGISVGHNSQIADLQHCHLILVCGGADLKKLQHHTLWLKPHLLKFSQKNIDLGGICTGAFLLAGTGLLDKHDASIHWENMLAARETFPNVRFNHNLYTIDRQRYTCSGGTASLDLCLRIIRQHHSRALAESIAEQFTLSSLRTAEEYRHKPLVHPQGSSHSYIIEAVVLMEQNLEDPLPISQVAALLNVSVRQLERGFKQYFQKSPQLYYTELRLQHAHRLICQTGKPIIDIALACGFSNPSNFSKAYRSHFRHTPSQARKHYQSTGL